MVEKALKTFKKKALCKPLFENVSMIRYFLLANINSLWCSLCQFAISIHIGGTGNGWKLEKLWQRTSGSEDCFLIRVFFGCRRQKTHWNNCQQKGELCHRGNWKCRHHIVTDPLSSSLILSYHEYGSPPQATLPPWWQRGCSQLQHYCTLSPYTQSWKESSSFPQTLEVLLTPHCCQDWDSLILSQTLWCQGMRCSEGRGEVLVLWVGEESPSPSFWQGSVARGRMVVDAGKAKTTHGPCSHTGVTLRPHWAAFPILNNPVLKCDAPPFFWNLGKTILLPVYYFWLYASTVFGGVRF